MTEDTSDSAESGRSIKPYAFLGAGVVVLLALAVVFSPYVKGAALTLYANPWIVQIGVIAALVTYGITRKYGAKEPESTRRYNQSRREKSSDRQWFAMVFAGVFFVLLLAAAIYTSALSGHAMGGETMQDAQTIDQMYEADADHPRIVTRAQAARWASGSIQSSQFQSSGNAIVVHNNTTYWASNLVPDGSIRNTISEKQSGTVLVNAETFDKDVKKVQGDMQVGRGMLLTDSIKWKLNHITSEGPWLVDYHTDVARPIVHEGDQYLIVPYTQPHHHLLPLTYSHPSDGGVALVHEDGTIEHYTLAEAQDVAALDGQPLLPPEYVKERVESTTYRAGIIDTLPVIGAHEETLSVAPVPGEQNSQPFYFKTEAHGAQYVTAAEPTGDTQGLRELWFTDVRTGEYAVYKSGSDSTLYGPRKSADFVIDANDRVDWNRFSPSEPIPTVVDGDLYWQFRVVQDGGGGITFVSMVNAESQAVTNIDDSEGTEAVSAFMRGEDVGNTTTTGEAPDDDRTPTLIVEKRNAEGEVVETMYVYGNETVVTKPHTGSTGNTTATDN